MPVEAKLVAEEPADEARREGCGEIAIDVRKFDMTEHDGIEFGHESGVGQHVLTQQLVEAGLHDRQFVMGVGHGPPACRKMFGAGGDATLAQGSVPLAGVSDDVLWITAPTAAAQGVLGGWVVIQIQHRCQIQVHA